MVHGVERLPRRGWPRSSSHATHGWSPRPVGFGPNVDQARALKPADDSKRYAIRDATVIEAADATEARSLALQAVEDLFRADSGRILGALVKATRDLELAQDAVQDAFMVATTVWPVDGVPPDPPGWIVTTAKRKAIDRIRRERRRVDKEAQGARVEAFDMIGDRSGLDDDKLRLLFTCCHPALKLQDRVALTLRTVCGLSTAAIARALVIPEATLDKRLVRTRSRIRLTGISYDVPTPERRGSRLSSVLRVIYLLFNEGYSASEGADLRRDDLAAEAIRLAELVDQLMPHDPETIGLLALMRLNHARRFARVVDGQMVLLADQDRSLWNRAEIAAAVGELQRAAQIGGVGTYWLQAAIAAEHALSPTAAATDWIRIIELYDELVAHTGSVVVELNRAVAVSMRHGPEAGLVAIEPLRARLDSYAYLHIAEADMLERRGEVDSARIAYQAALAVTDNRVQRVSIQSALARLEASTVPVY